MKPGEVEVEFMEQGQAPTCTRMLTHRYVWGTAQGSGSWGEDECVGSGSELWPCGKIPLVVECAEGVGAGWSGGKPV